MMNGDENLDDLQIVFREDSDQSPRQTHGFELGQFSVVGAPEDDDLRIYLDRSVHSWLVEFARTDTSRELGGVLVGTISGNGTTSVHIEAAIEAKYTESVQTSVKFTHESWEYINQVKDKEYPDKKIVGWFHTHPGFGIFLSSFDMFIHTNFFSLPWQAAFVVDPISGKDGFFQWKNGEVARCGGYYLEGKPVPPPEPVVAEPPRYRFGFRDAVIAIQSVLIIWLLVQSLMSGNRYEATGIAPTPPKSGRQSQPAHPKGGTLEAVPRLVIVQDGDSLWKVSERVYGTGRYYRAIAAANRVPPPYRVYPGQPLFIPVPESKMSNRPSDERGE